MDDPKLQDYLAVIRRRRRVVIITMLVAIAAAVLISLVQTPQYQAEAELLLRRTTSEQLLVTEGGQVRASNDSERELNNEIRLIESRSIRDSVEERYDGPLDVDGVSGSAPASDANDILVVSTVAANGSEAAELVNLYAETYITERQERQVAELLATGDEIRARLDTLREQIAEVRQPLDQIEAEVTAAAPDSPERTALEDERRSILAEVLPELGPLESRASSFQGQLQQLEVSQDLTRAGGVMVLTPADEPSSPVSPNTVANVVVGVLVGLLGGIALAFAVDYVDDSVGSKEDSERLTSLPTLGLIPKGVGSSTDLIAVGEPSSPTAEAYRSLRTSVKFLSLESSLKTIMITSPAASEGKTVTAANLATVLAQRGDRVLLVGADLRRPRVHNLFGAPQSPGLTTVLLGDATAESTIYNIAEVPGMALMPPGPTPPNPAELLDSTRAHELFASLSGLYDTVIVDAPPVLPVTDAQILAGSVDALLLVVAYRETSKRGLSRAIELLGQVEAPLVGTVLNLVPTKEVYGGQPYRYDTYRNRSERRRRREQPESTLAPAAHLAGLHGNGNARPLAPSSPTTEPEDGVDGETTPVADDAH